MRLVRGSEIDDFQRCRFRWKLRWIDGYQAKQQDSKLFFGNLFHKYQEVYSLTGDKRESFAAMKNMYDESPDLSMETAELFDLVTQVIGNYHAQWDQKDTGVTTVATEFTFAVPITETVCYTGTIDKIYMQDGFMYFKDYKSTSSIEKYQKRAAMDQQISRYWWALWQLANGNGFVQEGDTWLHITSWEAANNLKLQEPHGFIYDVILRDVPVIPEPLKKGGLSVAKAQKTTYAIYLKELVVNGFASAVDHHTQEYTHWLGEQAFYVDENYHDILAHLYQQETDFGNRFFQRFPVVRNNLALSIAIQEFTDTVMDMLDVEASLKNAIRNRIYRHNTDDCGWDCQFKDYCAATMVGADAQYLLDIGFIKEKEE